MSRAQERQAATVALYQHELTGQPLADALGPDASSFASGLAGAAAEHARELDAVVSRHAHGWSVERIHPLELAIMRIALVEMLHPELVEADAPIPAEGAIEEAVRNAKTFCGTEAPGFVNGVLDAALREVRDNAAHR